MIKTIIFDNNGVLTTSDEEETFGKVVGFFNTTINELKPVWKRLAEGVDEGAVTTEEFLKSVHNHYNSTRELSDLINLYYSSYNKKDEMFGLVKEVRNQYTVALLTNFGTAYDVFNKLWQFEEIFPLENIFVSSRLKMRKPQPEIYRHVADSLDLEPREAIFVDDNPKYVEAAKKVGINGILFKNRKQLEKELEKYGVRK